MSEKLYSPILLSIRIFSLRHSSFSLLFSSIVITKSFFKRIFLSSFDTCTCTCTEYALLTVHCGIALRHWIFLFLKLLTFPSLQLKIYGSLEAFYLLACCISLYPSALIGYKVKNSPLTCVLVCVPRQVGVRVLL